jgi:hypothetical protein
VKRGAGRKNAGKVVERVTDGEWPPHVRDAESRLQFAAWEALETVTGVSFHLLRISATDHAFLWLLGDALDGFHTHVELPEEYLLLRKRNRSTPITLGIAAERAGILELLCETTKEALHTETHLLVSHSEDRRSIAQSLTRVCDAAHTLRWLTQIFPHVPRETRQVPSSGCNRQLDPL